MTAVMLHTHSSAASRSYELQFTLGCCVCDEDAQYREPNGLGLCEACASSIDRPESWWLPALRWLVRR